MITKMHIENFKCFKNFNIDLWPFNVLIGPNDSGKTAFMDAIRLLAAMPPTEVATASSLTVRTGISLGPHVIWRQEKDIVPRFVAHAGSPNGGQVFELSFTKGIKFRSDVIGPPGHIVSNLPGNWKEKCFAEYIGKANYYHFDPRALRLPSLPSATLAENGEGLPTFIDAIHRNPNRSLFANLEAQFRKQFPHYTAIAIEIVQLPSGHAFRLSFQPNSGQVLPAENVSDGVMLSLAFMAVCQAPDPPSILLIEEPENGVHHASLKTTIETLRELNKKGVQIILTTHSPYLLDLVDPEEVRVFEKDDEGAVHAKKLSDFPDLERMKKHFMTGEIWTMLDKAKAEQV